MDDIWSEERRLWLEGADAYDELMAADCVMAFGPMGIMTRSEIVDSMNGSPRWSYIDMTDTEQTKPADNLSIIAYRASATRPGAEPYEAVCTSTYVLVGNRWKLAQHQQSVTNRL